MTPSKRKMSLELCIPKFCIILDIINGNIQGPFSMLSLVSLVYSVVIFISYNDKAEYPFHFTSSVLPEHGET